MRISGAFQFVSLFACLALLSTAASSAQTVHRTPLIVDDDGSADGIAGMIYLYYNPSFETKAWILSPGEGHPHVFATNLARLQAKLGITDVPIAAGPETPMQGTNTFPDAWRASSDKFWGLSLPTSGPAVDPRPAPQLIVDVIKASPEPVVVVATGPLTNLAEALALDPSIKDNIKLVVVSGGAIHVPGNIRDGVPKSPNTTAEWNIFVDPVAAEAVFTSGIAIRLMSLDVTNKIVFGSDQVKKLRSSKNPGAKEIADILDWELKAFNPSGVNVWDLEAAEDLTHPELTKTDTAHVEVVTERGANQGQTVVTSASPASVSLCSQPDGNGFRNTLVQGF